MIRAGLILVSMQLFGEMVKAIFAVPIPGIVIGMTVLAMACGILLRCRRDFQIPGDLDFLARGLIACLGLLFVPIGVGLIDEMDVLSREWLPLVAGVVGSTVSSIVVTGVLMNRMVKKRGRLA